MREGSGGSAGPGRGPVLASVGTHVLIVALAWLGDSFFKPPEVLFEAIAIEIVSPPPSIRGDFNPEPEPPPDIQVDTPDPTPPPPTEAPIPAPTPPPTRTPDPAPPREPERRPDPAPRPAPPSPAQPRPTPPPPPLPTEEVRPSTTPDPPPARESGMDIQVRMEGLRRDYPEYYNRIIAEVGRCFRWDGASNLAAVVRFSIQRSGSIDASGTVTVQSSGNLRFDLAVEGAVECAGTRLPPLPDDLPGDRLPVQFSFRPSGARELDDAAEGGRR